MRSNLHGEEKIDMLPKGALVLLDKLSDREFIARVVKKSFPGSLHLGFLQTESRFYYSFKDIARRPPDFILLDMRIRWHEQMPEPSNEVVMGTSHQAGLRCWNMLRRDPQTANIPIIFWTVIPDGETAIFGREILGNPLTQVVLKDAGESALTAAIRRALRVT
jgi:CheY-like chemotaxis protein